MIEVHIQHDIMRRNDDVFIVDRRKIGQDAVLAVSGLGECMWRVMAEPGMVYYPTLRLPEGVLEALVKASKGNVKIPTEATQAHLDDSIAVRDRLLTLVEAACHTPRITDFK